MTIHSPQISVILPVYNGGKYLKQAIESILLQTYTDFEFLIINDGSNDDTESIILSINDSRIIYHKNSSNKGIVETLNIGVNLSKGKYIARMDADDISYPNRLQLQYEFMEKNPAIGVCGAYMQILGTTNETVSFPSAHDKILLGFLKSNVIAHPVVMFKKQIFIDHNLKYEQQYFPAEDYMLWINFSKVCKLHNLPISLLKYKIHSESISVSKREFQLKKMDEIRSTYLLDSLSCFNEDFLFSVRSAFSFEFEDNLDYLLKLRLSYKTILEQNNKLNKFDKNELNDMLSFYWYVANKKVLSNGFKVMKIYSSIEIFKWNYFLKMMLYRIVKFKKSKSLPVELF